MLTNHRGSLPSGGKKTCSALPRTISLSSGTSVPPSLPREGFRYVLQVFYRVRLNERKNDKVISICRSTFQRLQTTESSLPSGGKKTCNALLRTISLSSGTSVPPSLPREGYCYILRLFYRVRLNIGMTKGDISIVRSRIDCL